MREPLYYAKARQAMLDSQLQPTGVNDTQVLEAFGRVPRENFVPEGLKGLAYMGDDLSLGQGRAMTQPMVLARLIQALKVEKDSLALIVGAGTGYSAALLAHLGAMVMALESDARLVQAMQENLRRCEIDTVEIVSGPLAEGYPPQAPYKAILIDGCVEYVPPALTDQLADQGRLIGVGVLGGVERGFMIEREGDRLIQTELFDAAAPRLPGFDRPRSFTFAA